MASTVHNAVIIKIPSKSTSIKTLLSKSKITVVGMKGIQGVQGDSGYTPIRGVDYFTESDVAAMVNAVAARFEDGDKEAY